MNREEAERLARVARRIGHPQCTVVTGHGEPFAGWERPCTGWIAFDPITNPADERLLWDWLETQPEYEAGYDKDGRGVEYTLSVPAGIGRGFDTECRVTALLMAIDALPDGDE